MTKPKPDAQDDAHDDADDLFNVPVEAPHPAGMADIERAITRAERRIKRRAAARRSTRTDKSALSLDSSSGDEPVSRRRIVWIACGALAAGAALALCAPVFKRASKKQESAPAVAKDASPHGDTRASMPAVQPSSEPLASRPAHDTSLTGEKSRAERTATAEPASTAKPSAARTPTPAPAVERAPVVAQSRDVVEPPPVVESPAVVPTAPAIQPPVVVQPAPTHIETIPAVVQAPLPAAHDAAVSADAHAESATPALRSSARAEPPLPVVQTSGSERLKVVEAALAAGRRAFARSELGRILLEIDVLPADAREETRAQAELLVARILQDAADGARRQDASDGARRPEPADGARRPSR